MPKDNPGWGGKRNHPAKYEGVMKNVTLRIPEHIETEFYVKARILIKEIIESHARFHKVKKEV